MNISTERLREQLKNTEYIEEIEKKIKNARCPICGGTLKYEYHPGGGDSIITPFVMSVTCNGCGLFRKEVRVDGNDAYKWHNDRSSEADLIGRLWSSIARYVKNEE